MPLQRRRGAKLVATGDPGRESATPDLAELGRAVESALAAFLDARVDELRRLDPALERIGTQVRDFVAAGGKRLRPAFVYWGYRATGAAHTDAVLAPAAAVELLHSFALIHDDVMDRSRLRRGRPTVHSALAALHGADGMVGDAAWFGVGGAILAGDLAFVWAEEMLDSAPVDGRVLERARAVFRAMQVEVMAGQFLDLRLSGRPDAVEADALQVALLKAGRYTVTRPLQLGAALGDSDPTLEAALRAYGDTIGIAFQLRDDVLGLFGDPETTGKSSVEDLREGKRTVLILRALAAADPAGRRELEGLLGNPDADEGDAERARAIVADSGALAAVEELLAERQRAAVQALERIPQPARAALDELARLALHRVA